MMERSIFVGWKSTADRLMAKLDRMGYETKLDSTVSADGHTHYYSVIVYYETKADLERILKAY